MGHEFLAQHPAGLHEEAPLDRLGRHLPSLRSRMDAGKPARDLLGRPVEREFRRHELAQLR